MEQGLKKKARAKKEIAIRAQKKLRGSINGSKEARQTTAPLRSEKMENTLKELPF